MRIRTKFSVRIPVILYSILVFSVTNRCLGLMYFGRMDHCTNGKYIEPSNSTTWIRYLKVDLLKTTTSNQTSKARLEVKPALIDDGRRVTLEWRDVSNPTTNDTIAFYCPETAAHNDYIDFLNVRCSPTFTRGIGNFSVVLTNLRANCEFRYFRNKPGTAKGHVELVATSNIVLFRGGPEIPLQIHLALTGDPTQMRVMWVSGTDETPIVKYGVSEQLISSVQGTSQTYSKTDFCSIVRFIDPGFIHDVLLSNLKPSTVYFYSCGVPGHMSEIRSFQTAPPVGSNASFKFIVYGDMGLAQESQATAKFVLKDVKDGYRFVFHNGDISYADGVEYIWDQWHALVQPISSIVPYMVGVGNHEQNHNNASPNDPSGATGNGFHPWWGNYEDDSNGECGVPFYYRFHMPDNGNHAWWYSYDYGMVHFIMMSTEHEMRKGSKQYTWLKTDLKNVDRSKTPWIILGGHRPMYNSQVEPDNFMVALGIQWLLEDLFHTHGVDLALWGHYHSYERTCALYRDACVDNGTVHVTIGTAGYKEDWPPYLPPAWSLYRRHHDSYGYGRVTIANRSSLHWEYFLNSKENVTDDVWLHKH